MKQLIFTFFAVVLCYSLFFDKKQTPVEAPVDEIKYMIEDASPIFYLHPDVSNTLMYNDLNPNFFLTWNPAYQNALIKAPYVFY